MSRSARGSEAGRAVRAGAAGALAAVLWTAGAVEARPRPEAAGTPPVVESVVVRADGLAGEQNMAELIAVRKGDPYSLAAVDRSVKQIYGTGLFADVRVLRTGEERVDLTFVLTHRLTVRSIDVRGAAELPKPRLRDALEALRPGAYFSEEKLARATAELREALVREGYFDASVEARTERNVDASTAEVVFDVSSWRRYRIAAVVFEGPALVPEAELRGKLRDGPGVVYVPSRLREDLQKVRGRFVALGYQAAEVELARETFDADAGRVSLAVAVRPGEKITLVIRGADVPVSILAPVWEERVFEEWGLAEGEARLLTTLRRRGHVFASLTSHIERAENELRVVYDVTPGERYRVDRVEFEGLTAFTPARLLEEVGISGKMPFFALVDGERLFEIPGAIEFFYRRNGYADCRVELVLKSRGKAATAVFVLSEGARRTIGRIEVAGVSLFPVEEVRAAMAEAEGRGFYPPDIGKDVERIDAFYLDRGVRGTEVASEVRDLGDGAAEVRFTVAEGRPVRIADVVVTGNRVTRKRIILRELRLKPGEPASRELILESKRRLEGLGVFSEVKVDEVAVSPGEENLVVTVREGERNYASLGVGVETRNEPRSLALWENDLKLRGTAEFIRTNILGAAAQLSLVSQFSLVEKRAVASWEQPYFLGIPMQTVLNGWLENEDRKSFGFDRRGMSLNLVKPLGAGLVLLGTVSVSRTKLTYLEIAESEVDRQLAPFSTALVSMSLIRDRRDDSVNPSRGTFLSAVGEWATPVLGTESDYLKAFLKFQSYQPVRGRLNFCSTFRLGLGRGRIPVPERFFAGGSNSFRGQRIDELGPKDPDTNMPIGGKAMLLANLEMRFPLFQSFPDLFGAVFYDIGQVFSKRKDFSLFNFQGAAGFGLRYRTPLGPVRIDLGWNVDDPEMKGRPIVFITIGNVF
jgi:outer membrane protein insertion porin family